MQERKGVSAERRTMELKYPHLFQSIKIGAVTLRNRIIASPTSHYGVEPPAYLKKECAAFYELRAKGGAAAVTLGDTVVHTRTGLMHPYKIRIDDPAVIPSLADTARAIRQHGAIPSLELTHGGKFANVNNIVGQFETQNPTYGPDHGYSPDGKEILAMPEELILEIVEAFGKGAAVAKMAGFGMVTVHGGHGWLIAQFMSPGTNHRTDRFGGSRENRMRFPLMVLDSIRAAVGPGFPIEFRMSGAEFTEGGYDLDEGVEIAKLLASKVDLLHVSAGFHDNPDTFVRTHPSMFLPHGCNVFLAERIKKAVDVPVATVGGLSDPAMMEEIIASGKADIVEMSRALIADPFLPAKARLGRNEDIVKCMRCFVCMNQMLNTRSMKCALNPVIGRELEHMHALPLSEPKRILVAGGGPAGMQAAIAAAGRGHSVILCEASDALGGQLKCEKYVPFKRELYDYVRILRNRMERAGVEVRLNSKVTPELVRSLNPDVLIAALGAEYIVPEIPGIKGENVRFLPALQQENPGFGKRVVVLGGGLVGCETAIHLRDMGHKVTIVEMCEDFAKDAPVFHKRAIGIQFREGITLELNTRVVEITKEGVRCAGPGGKEEFFPADTVFCAAGLRAREAEREELRNTVPFFFAVGDCVSPGQVTQAVSGGYYAALDI